MDRVARGGMGVASSDVGADLEARLARAEERVAFYASFDRVIQDNVSQASQLMRDALELRERTQAELEEARAEAEARVAVERGRYREDLIAVHAELVNLQATTATLARRVAATLGELAASDASRGARAIGGSAGVTFVAVADAPAGAMAIEPGQPEAAVEAGAGEDASVPEGVVAAPESTVAAGQDSGVEGDLGDGEIVAPVADGAAVGDADEAEVVEELTAAGDGEGAPDEAVTAGAGSVGAREDEAASAIDAEESAIGAGSPGAAVADGGLKNVAEPVAGEVGGPDSGAARFPVAADASGAGVAAGVDSADRVAREIAAAPGASRAVMVLVHGVPRAAAALSLQRHLHGLRHVESVEAREYAEGVLRLQVMTGGTLGLDDLKGWEAGSGMEPVTVTADVIEVRLPGAHGF